MMTKERIKDKKKTKKRREGIFLPSKNFFLEHIKIEIMQGKVQFHRLIVCIASKFQLV